MFSNSSKVYMENQINLAEVGLRLRQVRTQIARQSQEEFAGIMCMTQSNLSMIENQKVLPSCFLLYRIHTAYHINLNWVVTGEGEMLVNL
jgi:transcriptional regulator with XRE-family HTH domain